MSFWWGDAMGMGLGMGLSLSESGSSSAAWSPASIGGVILWLRADKGASPAAWAEQTHGYSFVQSTPGNQPTVNATGGPNGTARMTFAGSQWLALSQSISAVAGCTSIVIAKLNAGNAANAGAFCAADAGNDYNSANGAIFCCYGTAGDLMGYAGGFKDYTTGVSAAFHSFRMDAGALSGGVCTVTMSVDGAAATSFIVATDHITPTTWSVGSRVTTGAAGGAPFAGDICEIIVTSGQMSAGDLAKLSAYTTSRYGLAA